MAEVSWDESDYLTGFEAQVTELENGIFNMVITLCQVRASTMPKEAAYTTVAQYLERLASGLTTMTLNEGSSNGRSA